MTEPRRDVKKTVWIYAVVIFSSAFIVLLITAYSQIKLNNNLSLFQSQVEKGDEKQSTLQEKLAKSENEAKNLSEEKAETETKLISANNTIKKLQQQIEDSAKENKKNDLRLKLLNIAELYFSNQSEAAADAWMQIPETEATEASDLQLMTTLKEKVVVPVARTRWQRGYQKYVNGDFSTAEEWITSALKGLPAAEQAEPLYFLMWTTERLGKHERAVEAGKKLLTAFPEYPYAATVRKLINQ